MIEPQLTPDEPLRLAALRDLNILETSIEERFERITRLARRTFGVPIAAVSLLDAGLRNAVTNSVQNELISQIATEQRQAMVDCLTRLWNRTGIFEHLQFELAPARRTDGAMALMMIDLDGFKPINDTHGHPAGDEVLRQVARRMLAAVRDADSVGRYGGDEFMVVMGTCAGPDDALAVAERLRRRVMESPITTEAGPISPSVSVGVAFVDLDRQVSPDEVLAVADDALYRAKRGGKDRVELCSMARRKAS